MGINTVPQPSYSTKLAACEFWLFPKLLLWDNWGDKRGCDVGHWHAHTRGLPWGLPEVVGTAHHVHCSRKKLLRSGLKFHVCTINKRAHTKKKFGNLFNDPRIFINIYFYFRWDHDRSVQIVSLNLQHYLLLIAWFHLTFWLQSLCWHLLVII